MTDWYRRSTEELRAKQEYDEERDRVLKPRTEQSAPVVPVATMPKPWEGITEMAQAMGMNLGEMWKSREQEIKDARESQSSMERELHELRVLDIDRRVAELQRVVEEAKARAQGGGDNPPTRHAKMEDAIDNLIASRLDKLLGGNEQPQLTKEDIQRIATEAVNAGKNGQTSPQQMMETFMSFISSADEAKKKMAELGGGQPGGNPYLTQAGSLRGDVLRVLLENDLAKIKLQQDYDIQQERTKHLGALAGTVKNSIEDFAAASRDEVKDHRESKSKQRQRVEANEEQGGYGVRCSECGQISTYPEMPSGTFPCQQCGAQIRLQLESPHQPPPPQRPQPPPMRPMTGLDF